MKFLSGLLALISSLFVTSEPAPKSLLTVALNNNLIAYHETYFAPVVAEPGNFPFAKKQNKESKELVNAFQLPAAESSTKIPVAISQPPIQPPAPIPVIAPSPPEPVIVLPPIEQEDPYLPKIEPVTDWLSANLSFIGKSSEGDRTLPEITFDREYWRMEVFSYWAPDAIPPKPTIEKDYFKLEVYEAVTNKLIYTMSSGNDESMHKFQVFKKAGKYYFKVYSKSPSQWEMTLTVSPKLAK